MPLPPGWTGVQISAPVACKVRLVKDSTGPVVSWTAMMKSCIAVLPCRSLTTAWMACVPMAKTSPDATALPFSVKEIVRMPSTASFAVVANVTALPSVPAASRVRLVNDSTGAVVSSTVKLKVLVVVRPAPSVAVAVIWWTPKPSR